MGAVRVDDRTIEHVAMDAKAFPSDLLAGCESGLCLFAAAFLGVNDAIHFLQRGIPTTCVDTDWNTLAKMRELYPQEWTFVEADAWTYAEAARDLDLTWDAVSVDTWTGDASARSMDSLELWSSLATRLLVVTKGRLDSVPQIPAGWSATQLIERSDRADWLVLERAS